MDRSAVVLACTTSLFVCGCGSAPKTGGAPSVDAADEPRVDAASSKPSADRAEPNMLPEDAAPPVRDVAGVEAPNPDASVSAQDARGEASTPQGLPAGYSLQIDESFSTAASLADVVFANPKDWRFQEMGGGSLETTGNSYVPPHRSPTTVAVVATRKVGSFVLEVEIMETSADFAAAHRDFCILFNMQNPSRFYYAHVSARHDADQAHHIQIVNDADRRPITEKATAGFDWGRMAWKKLRIVRDVTSGLIEVFDGATGELLLSATDRTFQDGFIGFGSIGDTGRIRNLRVWAAAATSGPAAFFQRKP